MASLLLSATALHPSHLSRPCSTPTGPSSHTRPHGDPARPHAHTRHPPKTRPQCLPVPPSASALPGSLPRPRAMECPRPCLPPSAAARAHPPRGLPPASARAARPALAHTTSTTSSTSTRLHGASAPRAVLSSSQEPSFARPGRATASLGRPPAPRRHCGAPPPPGLSWGGGNPFPPSMPACAAPVDRSTPACCAQVDRLGPPGISSRLPSPPLRSSFLSNRLPRPASPPSLASLRRPGLAAPRAFFEVVTVLAVAGAAVMFLVLPIVLTTLAVAGTAAVAVGAVLAVLAPLSLFATGITALSLPAIWGIIDRLLFVAVALNFILGVAGLAAAKDNPDAIALMGLPKLTRKNRKAMPKRVQRWLQREGFSLDSAAAAQASAAATAEDRDPPALRRGFWFTPTLLSLAPGLHGAAWLVAFSDWPSSAWHRWDFRTGMLRNSLVYGGTGLLGLLLGHPFGGGQAATVVAVTKCFGLLCVPAGTTTVAAAAASSGSFWLSVVLGAAHLQLDRAWLRDAALRKLPAGAGEDDVIADVTAGVAGLKEEQELSRRDLEEFDAQLRYRTEGGYLGRRAADWSTAEVALWLEDNGFGVFAEEFKGHDISGRVLLALTEPELRTELGMGKLGQRKRLMLLIDELRRQRWQGSREDEA